MITDWFTYNGNVVVKIEENGKRYMLTSKDGIVWSGMPEDNASNHKKDDVNHPSHYTQGKIEVISFIEDQKLGYHLGNAIKYICRCNHKGNKKKDLEKAIWYLKRELEKEVHDLDK